MKPLLTLQNAVALAAAVGVIAFAIGEAAADGISSSESYSAPSRTIFAGHSISESDLKELPKGREDLPAAVFALRKKDLIGMVARQVLLLGRPVPRNAVRPAYIVRQGQQVSVKVEDHGLMIVGTGVPLESGSMGDAIDVRNMETGNTMHGKVVGYNSVDLGESK